jgi:coenzyme F420-0:L-glutamate ligase/coenzyme F420-1:gamma-L-glutamate ligase
MDHSNARSSDQWRLLLPLDPDHSARELRKKLGINFGVTIGIVISDSHGRPFRMGTVGVAIGSAGLPSLWDLRGRSDLFGHSLQVTEVGFADEIAAAAGLVLGQAAEALPVVIVRGLGYPINETSTSADLVRPREMDLYR